MIKFSKSMLSVCRSTIVVPIDDAGQHCSPNNLHMRSPCYGFRYEEVIVNLRYRGKNVMRESLICTSAQGLSHGLVVP
jgi:hypothetical protein